MCMQWLPGSLSSHKRAWGRGYRGVHPRYSAKKECRGTPFFWDTSLPLFGASLSEPRISLVPRPNPHAEKRVWCTSSDFLGFQDAKQSCDINYCHGNALSGMRVAHATTCNTVASFAPLVRCHMKNHMP